MESLKNFFDRKFELSKKDILSIAITAVYALITIILVAHHEPFEDEVNVWMILHNLEGFAMWKHIFEDGNPPGFYMLLLPFVKAGMSYFCVQFACWLSCVLSVFLLNRFSPFPAFLNIIITFSAPMLYVYPVIARCYSLLPLLIMLAAVLYPCGGNSGGDSKSRNDEIRTVLYLLVLAAIAQNHVIMFAFAGLMFALFVYQHFYKAGERRPFVIAAAAAGFVALAAILLQSFIAIKMNFRYSNPDTISFLTITKVLSDFFSCFFDITKGNFFYSTTPDGGFLFYTALFIIVGFVAFLFYYLLKSKKTFFSIALLSVLFPLYIYITRSSTVVIPPYRVFIVHLFLIFFFWIILENRHKEICVLYRNKLFLCIMSLVFLVSVPSGISISLKDLKKNFSSAGNIAFFIEKNIPDDGQNIIVSPVSWLCAGVAFHLKDRAIYSMNGNRIMFIDMHPDIMENRLAERGLITKGKKLYVLMARGEMDDYRKNFLSQYALVYETPASMIINEDFLLYRVF